jgi:hypothetical protein
MALPNPPPACTVARWETEARSNRNSTDNVHARNGKISWNEAEVKK